MGYLFFFLIFKVLKYKKNSIKTRGVIAIHNPVYFLKIHFNPQSFILDDLILIES
jgi:hypothetical protein